MIEIRYEYNGQPVSDPSKVPNQGHGSILFERGKDIHKHADNILCPDSECKNPHIVIVVGFTEPASLGNRCIDFCHSKYVDAINEKLPMKLNVV